MVKLYMKGWISRDFEYQLMNLFSFKYLMYLVSK